MFVSGNGPVKLLLCLCSNLFKHQIYLSTNKLFLWMRIKEIFFHTSIIKIVSNKNRREEKRKKKKVDQNEKVKNI